MLPILLGLAAFGGGTYKAVNSDQLGVVINDKKEPGILNDWRSVGAVLLTGAGIIMGGRAGVAAAATGLGLGMSYAGTEITRQAADEQLKQLAAPGGAGPGGSNKAPLAAPFTPTMSGDFGWGPAHGPAMGWTPAQPAYGCQPNQPVPMHERAPGPYAVPFYAGAQAPLMAPF